MDEPPTNNKTNKTNKTELKIREMPHRIKKTTIRQMRKTIRQNKTMSSKLATADRVFGFVL